MLSYHDSYVFILGPLHIIVDSSASCGLAIKSWSVGRSISRCEKTGLLRLLRLLQIGKSGNVFKKLSFAFYLLLYGFFPFVLFMFFPLFIFSLFARSRFSLFWFYAYVLTNIKKTLTLFLTTLNDEKCAMSWNFI